MHPTLRAVAATSLVAALSPAHVAARSTHHAPGFYAMSVDERCAQENDEGGRNFTLRVSIADCVDRRVMAGGTVRLPFVAFGETYVFVLRQRRAQITYLDGYTVSARYMVTYPSDLRRAVLYRGTMLDVDEREIDADGMLEMRIDVALLQPGEF